MILYCSPPLSTVSSRIMSKQKETRFSWVLKNFCSLQHNNCYSRTFVASDCNWRLLACYNKDRNGYLSLYLELADPASLPLGWRRQVNFRLTLVNKVHKQSTRVLEGKHWFDANDYGSGYKDFLPLHKLHARGNGFLVRDRLIIVAEVQILPAIDVPKDTVKITEPLCWKEGDPATDASEEDLDDYDDSSEEDLDDNDDDDASEEGFDDTDASEEVLDDDDESEESLDDDDDDDAFEEDLDDDDSSPVSDDEGQEICPLNQLNAWNKASRSVGNRGMKCNNVIVSDADTDDTAKEDLFEDGTVEEDPDDDDASSLHQWESMVYTSKTVEKFGTESKETIDVNGFQVLASQVQSVSQIFKRHPDTAIGFRPKNQQIRKAYMDALLSLIETLCQSPDKLSDDDLSNADETLVDLIDVDFKLDWLKTKLNDVSEKKKLGESSVVRLETMEEQLQKLKHMVLDLESQMQKEKEKVLAARAPLSFKDILY
ncbi:putative MATH/TRAF domain-containing protein [Arabidopsis thaliana]